MKKKISVIIPYFKNLKYLPIAIKSVVDQKEVLDWISEAGFFRVEVDKSKNFFGGVCDLGMKVSLKDFEQ